MKIYLLNFLFKNHKEKKYINIIEKFDMIVALEILVKLIP